MTAPDPARLDALADDIAAVVLAKQHPISGLLPASVAVTAHGDYRDAWVRDDVYSILCVWAAGRAFRRLPPEMAADPKRAGRADAFDGAAVKLMRGLLTAMMRQTGKLERFKHSLDPMDALHAKYDTATGDVVAGDGAWGHLQIDATSLYLLTLAQMTAGGLRIVLTLEEVAFVQNLAHYVARAWAAPDYGIWERGDKQNHGIPELNCSSLGMAKAALEALDGLNLFGPDGGQAAVVDVAADDVARLRSTLEALLPRESRSKEVDAALLSVIGYPAYAVERIETVDRTRAAIRDKLEGPYGAKRFLRDGHQTAVEDEGRLHYEAGELERFAGVESEWPLFAAFGLLDAAVREDAEAIETYGPRLERLYVQRGGRRLLPELYTVPSDKLAAERAAPGSVARVSNDNVPLVWAQSLAYCAQLVLDGHLTPEDLDPLGRRRRPGRVIDATVRIAPLPTDGEAAAILAANGIPAASPDDTAGAEVRPAADLAAALTQLGSCPALGLTGRPPRRLGSPATAGLWRLGGRDVVVLPDALDGGGKYGDLEPATVARRLRGEIAYLRRHWDRSEDALLPAALTGETLRHDAPGAGGVLDLLREAASGRVGRARTVVARLDDHLAAVRRIRIDCLRDFALPAHPPAATAPNPPPPAVTPDAPPVDLPALARATDAALTAIAADGTDPATVCAAAVTLAERVGFDHRIPDGRTLRAVLTEIERAARHRRIWSVLRWCAGRLGRHDPRLEDAVAEIVVRGRRLSVGRAYAEAAVVDKALPNAELVRLIAETGGDDSRGRALIEEIVVGLGLLIKADPAPFEGTLTLRPWHLLLLVTGERAFETGITQSEAFSAILDLSPADLLSRVRAAIERGAHHRAHLALVEGLRRTGDARAAAGETGIVLPDLAAFERPDRPADWAAERALNGVVTRLPAAFHAGIWDLLSCCRALVVGDRIDPRNRLDGPRLRADMTPGETQFALAVDDILNRIPAPEYRQLSIEALWALIALFRANPGFKLDGGIVVDAVVGHAVRLAWTADAPPGARYDDCKGAAWDAFYAAPPETVAEFAMRAVLHLLETGEAEPRTAAE